MQEGKEIICEAGPQGQAKNRRPRTSNCLRRTACASPFLPACSCAFRWPRNPLMDQTGSQTFRKQWLPARNYRLRQTEPAHM